MGANSDTQYNITANASKLFSELDKVKNRFKKTEKGIKQVASGIATSLAGLGVGAVFGDVIRTTTQFEQRMNNVAAVTQAFGSDLQTLRKLAREMGETTRFTSVQAAEGLQFLAMAGFETQEAISALPGVLELATAGALDLATAADIATNVLTGFGLAVFELGRVNDVLALTAASANTNIEQLGGALKFVAPVASGLGVELEEVSAVLATFANRGIRSFLAGTNLRAILQKLIAPSAKAKKVLAEHNLVIDETVLSTEGLVGVFKILAKAQLNGIELSELFGTEIQASARILLESTDAVEKFAEELRNADGDAARMAEEMNRGLPGALKRLESTIESVKISIGEGLVDAITGVTETIRDFAKAFIDAPRWARIATGAFLGIIAVITPLIAAIGVLVIAFGGIPVLIGTAVIAFIALLVGITDTEEGFKKLEDAMADAKDELGEVVEKQTQYKNELLPLLATLANLETAEEDINKRLKKRKELIAAILLIEPDFAEALNVDTIKASALNEVYKLLNAELEKTKRLKEGIVTQQQIAIIDEYEVSIGELQEKIDKHRGFAGKSILGIDERRHTRIADAAQEDLDRLVTKIKVTKAILRSKGINLDDIFVGPEAQGIPDLLKEPEMMYDFTPPPDMELPRISTAEEALDEYLAGQKETSDKLDKILKDRAKDVKARFERFKVDMDKIEQDLWPDMMDLPKIPTADEALAEYEGMFEEFAKMPKVKNLAKLSVELDWEDGTLARFDTAADKEKDELIKTFTDIPKALKQDFENLKIDTAFWDDLFDSSALDRTSNQLNDYIRTLSTVKESLNKLKETKLEDEDVDQSRLDTIKQLVTWITALIQKITELNGKEAEGVIITEAHIQKMQEAAAVAQAFGDGLGKMFRIMIEGNKEQIKAQDMLIVALLEGVQAYIAVKAAQAAVNLLAYETESKGLFGLIAAVVGLGALGGIVAGIKNNVASFAEGGVVSGPTLAMVGDAPGMNNPEYISPRKDMIKDIQAAVGNAGGSQNVRFVIRGQDLVTVLDNEHTYRDAV